MDPAERRYRCGRCSRTFLRSEHLKRHLTRHTGEKAYVCACGEAFNRSDVLAIHARTCGRAGEAPAAGSRATRKRLRKVCNACARLKIRCDQRRPCLHCGLKNVPCKYQVDEEADGGETRRPAEPAEPAEQMAQMEQTEPADFMEPDLVLESACAIDGGVLLRPEPAEDSSVPTWIDIISTVPPTSSWSDLLGSVSSISRSITHVSSLPSQDGRDKDAKTSGPFRQTAHRRCFHLPQLDPVEAKRQDILAMLRVAARDAPGTDDGAAACLTRPNLVRGLELYGQHFQRHLPILHAATFDMTRCAPHLLLAMFCCGASYDHAIASTQQIYSLARRALVDIAMQRHEKEMAEPPLATIQAAICACSVLASSLDEVAQSFASVHLARCVSMAQRAHLFDAVEHVDYAALTSETFDWPGWIHRETQTRIVNVVFTQNVAQVVFLGSTPDLSPLELEFNLPCYEACWEARSGRECLLYLQSTPAPIRMGAAMRQLQAPPSGGTDDNFEASAAGMFTLISGLHCMVWHTTRYGFNMLAKAPGPSAPPGPSSHGSLLEEQLARGFSGLEIATLASQAVLKSQDPALLCVNQALDTWLHIWNARQFRDTIYEYRAFSLDPAPFWWLAKLFLLLHCRADEVADESEFACLRNRSNIPRKVQAQARIFSWLTRLRYAQEPERSPRARARASLADLMEPMESVSE